MKYKNSIGNIIFILMSLITLGAVVFATSGDFFSYPTDGTGSINYYRPTTSGAASPGQNRQDGWRSFGSESFDIFTPEYCKQIIHTGTVDIFIPTRTPEEWNSFKTRVYSGGISIGSCSSGSGCDDLSGPVCGVICVSPLVCEAVGQNYDNECDMVSSGRFLLNYGSCVSSCNPLSGPVCASRPCNPKIGACTDVITYYLYDNECAAEASGATVGDMSNCGGGV